MADMFDYLKWRGDILFSQVPLNDVDSLIFSSLAYVQYNDIITEDKMQFVPLREAARILLALPDAQSRCRVPNDLLLLKAAAETERFGRVGLCAYQDILNPEEETQFAAITFMLEDGTAFLAFRGTDSTLVGWKEDFNMTFQESIPAQRLAKEYVQRFASVTKAPLRLGGHSKGGNLAVYAGAKCGESIQDRILDVYNHDGPGFTQAMMTDPGYLRIVPRVKTLVPQSSIFGMLLDHQEAYTIIRSNQVGIMQHDPYSWEVMGSHFILVEELTANSKFLDRTFRTWLAGLTPQERNTFFDSVFDVVMTENTGNAKDLLKPQAMFQVLRNLQSDEERRNIISSVLNELMNAAIGRSGEAKQTPAE